MIGVSRCQMYARTERVSCCMSEDEEVGALGCKPKWAKQERAGCLGA
jgi:hypothetical protein